MTSGKYGVSVCVAVAFACSAFACGPSTGDELPKIKAGRADLSQWNFRATDVIVISGEWEFYWNELLPPAFFESTQRAENQTPARIPRYVEAPHLSWESLGHPEFGYATYHATIQLPADIGTTGLWIPEMSSAYNLYVNERLVASNGRVSNQPALARAEARPRIAFFEPPPNHTVSITLQISNYHFINPGFRSAIRLGPAEMIRAARERAIAVELFLAGSLSIVGIYHLALFLLDREARSHMYFGLFCIAMTVRLLVTGEKYILELSPFISFDLHSTVNYGVWAALPVFFSLFIRSLYPQETSRFIIGIIIAGSAAVVVLAVVTIPAVHAYTLNPNLALQSVGILYFAFVLVRAAMRRRDGAAIMLGGQVFLIGTFVHDMLHLYRLIYSFEIFSMGVFGFILAQAYVLALRRQRLNQEKEEARRSAWHHRRREMERTQQVKRLQEIDQVRTMFFTNISHEFRTPLTLIIGPLKDILEQKDLALDAGQRKALWIAWRNAHILLRLVNAILDISALEAGKLEPKLRPVELTSFVKNVAAMFESLAASRGLEYRVEFPSEQIIGRIDPELMERALLNVIANALKFTGHGTVHIAVKDANDSIRIAISDSGRGIPLDRLGKIFERYSRVSVPESEAAMPSGSGLGLYLTREIMQVHGGEILVESREGIGSTFTLVLPVLERSNESVAPESIELSAATSEAENPANRAWVEGLQYDLSMGVEAAPIPEMNSSEVSDSLLIIEDSAELNEYLRSLLGNDFVVHTARDGYAGLKMARELRPDIVLSDLMIPGIDGLDLVRAIRDNEQLSSTIIVALTARADGATRRRGLELGFDDYITKPFDGSFLRLRLRNLLRSREYRLRAIAGERRRIFADLHDVLGSNLAELSLILRRESPDTTQIAAAKERLEEARRNLRDILFEYEDLEEITEDFALGLRLNLARRYSAHNREIEFQADSEIVESFFARSRDPELRATIFAVCREIATNDLKYGYGVSAWGIVADSDSLAVSLRGGSSYASDRVGHGRRIIEQRLRKLNASYVESRADAEFAAVLTVRLTG